MAHIGVHKQKQEGLNWIGVALPLGKVTCEQMRGLARIAQDLGDGDIRLTVWQNLLIPGVRDANVELAIAAIRAMGLDVETSQVRAGLIACTGRAGCKFGLADTKRTAADNATVRSVFLIGPDKKIKAMLTYPMSTGRNFDEVLRILDSIQLTAKHKVSTPVNWKQGEDVIIAGSVSDDDAKKTYPQGWKAPKPYLRIVPQPK